MMMSHCQWVTTVCVLESFRFADYGVVAHAQLVQEQLLVWLQRPILDLNNLLQPWHMKSYAPCDTVEVTSLF